MKTIIQIIFIILITGSVAIAKDSKIPEKKVIEIEDYKELYSNIPKEIEDLFTEQKTQGQYVIVEYTGWGTKRIFSAIKKDNEYIKHGMFREYFHNNTPDSFSFYLNGKLDGPQVSYFPNGKMQYKQFYKRGKRDGRCIRWNPEGKITTDCIFLKGKPMNGFSFSGTPFKYFISTYKDGKLLKKVPCDIHGNTRDKIKQKSNK